MNSSLEHSATSKNASKSKPKTNGTGLVVTKTSPLVAAELDHIAEEEVSVLTDLNTSKFKEFVNDATTSLENSKSLIDNNSSMSKHEIIKKVQDSMDYLRNELLHKGMNKYAEDVDVINKNLEASRKKQEEMERIKREQELIRIEKERIEKEKEKLRQEAEQLKIERELILMNSPAKSIISSCQTVTSSVNYELPNAVNIMNSLNNAIKSSSSSSTSSTHDQLDINNLDILNDIQMSNKRAPLIGDATMSPKFALNRQQQQQQHQRFVEMQRLPTSYKPINQQFENVNLRRSVPNLLVDQHIPYQQNLHQSINLSNSQMMMSDSHSSNALNRLSYRSNQKFRQPSSIQTTPTHQVSGKPPPHAQLPVSRMMSTSQNDLKNVYRQKLNAQQNKLYNNGQASYINRSMLPNQPFIQHQQQTQHQTPPANMPTISLNEKCTNCSQILGQGSAMYIEKLGLAFHLKCFRCSVCNVPLGNGKEGTDVRVSGANRLHCNNCFSNDLGNFRDKLGLGLDSSYADFFPFYPTDINMQMTQQPSDHNRTFKSSLNQTSLSDAEQICSPLFRFKIKLNPIEDMSEISSFILPNYSKSFLRFNSSN
jgi:hypothetical protein